MLSIRSVIMRGGVSEGHGGGLGMGLGLGEVFLYGSA